MTKIYIVTEKKDKKIYKNKAILAITKISHPRKCSRSVWNNAAEAILHTLRSGSPPCGHGTRSGRGSWLFGQALKRNNNRTAVTSLLKAIEGRAATN